jgi:hypothetical protein
MKAYVPLLPCYVRYIMTCRKRRRMPRRLLLANPV